MSYFLRILVFLTVFISDYGFVHGQQLGAAFQIAYENYASKDYDICVIKTGNSEITCLTSTPDIDEVHPAWSPNGKYLLYYKSQPGQYPVSATADAFIIDLENNQTAPVAIPNWNGYTAGWSPDSNQLLLVGSKGENGRQDIFIAERDGSNSMQITNDALPKRSPSWSPDGNSIAYVTDNLSGTLMLVSPATRQSRTLTSDIDVNPEVQPAWSPDSSEIAFVVRGKVVASTQTSEIYLVNADGTNLHQLTNTGGINFGPRWSPNGKQIVFYGYKVGAFDSPSTDTHLTEIFTVQADGTNQKNLTNSEGADVEPDWSPDGKWIAFASTRIWKSGENYRSGIFIMKADGSDVQILTNLLPHGSVFEGAQNPVWRPGMQS